MNQNTIIFIQENAFESDVCRIWTILFSFQYMTLEKVNQFWACCICYHHLLWLIWDFMSLFFNSNQLWWFNASIILCMLHGNLINISMMISYFATWRFLRVHSDTTDQYAWQLGLALAIDSAVAQCTLRVCPSSYCVLVEMIRWVIGQKIIDIFSI